MQGPAFSAKQTQAAAEEEAFKPQVSENPACLKCSADARSSRTAVVQTLQLKARPTGSQPSVVSAMNPAEFPFPAVPSTSFHSKALDMPFITDAKHLPVADMKAGKFLVIPYDDSAPFGQQQNVRQEENEREPMVRVIFSLVFCASHVVARPSSSTNVLTFVWACSALECTG